jgi:monothiol glutaredoxin
MDNIFAEIKKTVEENKVVLYMKGSKDFPQCGFSATVVQILRNLNVNFVDINVLTNPEIREGIKEFSDWPTIPQLYVDGEFIGGCDIVKEMFQAQELQELLKEKKII